MSISDGCYLTDAGADLITKLLATETELSITRAALGCGLLTSDQTPQEMTDLSDYVMDVSIESVSTVSSGQARVVLQCLSSDVETSFVAKEAALFADDPDDGEILYTYVSLNNDPISIPASDDDLQKMIRLELFFITDNVGNVTATIDPLSVVTPTTLENYQLKTDLLPTATVISDNDSLPVYAAASSGHKKISWSTLKTAITTVLGSVFAPLSHTHTKSSITDFAHNHSKNQITDFPSEMRPSAHASATSEYGVATSTSYGHTLLSESVSSNAGASSGTAATPKAVKTAYDLAASKAETTTYTFSTELVWNSTDDEAPYQQTISVEGILSTDNPIASLVVPSDYEDVEAAQLAFSEIYRITTAADSVTLYAHSALEATITIQLKVVR